MENPASTGEPGLFHEVVFYVVESDKLTREQATKVKKTLLEHGAIEAEHRTDPDNKTPFDPLEVTHVIAADVDFPGQLEVEEAMKAIVTPAWVETSVAKKRLAHVRLFTPDPKLFFSGVIVTIAELPVGDKEAICGGILAMGGQYSTNLTKLTTHIVALNMDNEKCTQAVAKKVQAKIVLPHWFDDCLKLNRRIDEAPYLLPNPEIERLHSTEPLPIPRGPDLTYTHASIAEKPPNPRPNFKVFSGKKVCLGTDLDISQGLRSVISTIIEEAHGEITDNILDAHVYVGQWREGTDYVTASRKGCDVGNLTWLYWMFAHGKWTNPMKRLLHYPLVRNGIPGMRNLLITVSNYGGDARLYLESLIVASGATFTKSMKAENTHLITAREHSEKCTAAKEWNIHMVNHLWIEESYAKWQVLTVTDPKYTHFPTRTNLMEVVGQTQICPRTIQQFYDVSDDVDMASDDGNSSALYHENPKEVVMSTMGGGDVPTLPKPRGRPPKTLKLPPQEFSTPRNKTTTGSDTSSVITTGGRRAKEAATQRLHELAPDIALYEKEMKRKGSGLWGATKRQSLTPGEHRPDKKRAASSAEPDLTADEEGDINMGEAKPKKTKKRVKPTIRVLVTGYTWKDEVTEKRKLAEIGIQCISEPSADCTHLAAPKIVRTEKFLCALAHAPTILSTSWIESCLESGHLVDESAHILSDPDGEAKMEIKLSESLVRAKKLKGTLLEGTVVYCTPNVTGGFDTYSHIVQANGGICINFKTGKRGANTPEDMSGKLVLLSSDAAADQKLWKPFVALAKGLHAEPLIYRTDWLLTAAMRQKVEYDDGYLLPQKKK
ncbi:BRCT domain-containing protein [Peziza echinospora]|nr:BRCT domain-containing protein [Peziza echinospora]